MTVGEKIQELRKQKGLSQEGLGNMLNISRQTVSLWENNQTYPTLDNLLLLKDIFGVSADELLGCEQPASEPLPDAPVESFSFSFSEQDIKALARNEITPRLIKPVIISVFLIFTSFGEFYISENGVTHTRESFSLALICLPILAVYLAFKARELIKLRKKWKGISLQLENSIQEYDFYPTYFSVTSKKGGEITGTQKIFLDSIRQFEKTGGFIKLFTDSNILILKENEIPESSPFLYYINTSPLLTQKKKPFGLYNLISVVLFIASIFAVPAAMMSTALFSMDAPEEFINNIWIFFLFIPVPLASVIFGIVARKKGYKFTKNFVAGIIVSILLLLYGSFTFVFGGMFTEDPMLYNQAQELTGIELPEYERIQSHNWTTGTQTTSRGYIFSTTTLSLKEKDALSFRTKCINDSRWLRSIPTELVGITSAYCDINSNSYYLIYNINSKEFNTLPENNGKYHFINIIFSPAREEIMIVDYEISYVG